MSGNRTGAFIIRPVTDTASNGLQAHLMSGITSFLRSRKLGKEGLIMGAARIMFHRSDGAEYESLH